MNEKNILILVATLGTGGAERAASRLANEFKEHGYNVIVGIFRALKEGDYNTTAEVVNFNIPYTSSDCESKIGRALSQLKRLLAVKKLKRERNITACISFLEGENLLNVLSGRREKVIIGVRSYYSSDYLSFLNKKYIHFFYSKADIIVANARSSKEDLVNNFKIDRNKIVTIANLFDGHEIKKLSKTALDSEVAKIYDHPTILTVGRLTWDKGQWILIKAFALLKNKIPNLKLVVIGSLQGEITDQLLDLATTLKLKMYVYGMDKQISSDNDIFFLGQQKNIFSHLSRATLFALPSLSEGFPNVLVEAMLCELPVVAADCVGGIREIIAPNNFNKINTNEIELAEYGILMPRVKKEKNKQITTQIENIDLLWEKALHQLLLDNELHKKYKNKAIERANEFDTKTIFKEWENLI